MATLKTILAVAVLLGVSRAIVAAAWLRATHGDRVPAARSWFHGACGLISVSVFIPIVVYFTVDPDAFFKAPIEIGYRMATAHLTVGPRLHASATAAHGMDPKPYDVDAVWITVVLVSLVFLALLGSANLFRQTRKLSRLCSEAVVWKAFGRIQIAVSPVITGPLCAWVSGRCYVLLPVAVLGNPARIRLILSHEFSHVRGGHLICSWAMAILCALMPWNIAVRAWQPWLRRVQDLACDQAVVARAGIERTAYGACLHWVASMTTNTTRAVLSLAMSDSSPSFLKWRITMILNQQRPTRRGLVFVLAVAGAAMGSTALAIHGFAADRRISATEVQRIADRCLAQEGIHLSFNDHAVENINRAITAGRRFFRDGIQRLEPYRPVGSAALARHGVPNALLAIPIIESGVGASFDCECDEKIVPGDAGPGGIWQMIGTTASAYGLRVDSNVDERFDQAREADAAARLLSDLHRTFDDWLLAIAAYNAGSTNIKAAIRAGGTRDVLELQKKGLLNPYLLSDVVPAMVLRCAPELLAD